MEVNGRLLTEAESAELAGVSPETIRQYGEFGLLMPVEKDGQLFFQEAEIRTLFYTKAPTPPKDRPENGHSFTLRAFDIHAEPQT
ncbi:MAG TPA: MerR family transcriptional regulator, partial [Oligoflexia bacterium]|nr:MerR family transcriptional regulator [Oligoflexia bacterium]